MRPRKLNFYHQVQLRRQHLPAAQDARHGGAQQHVRVAALVHRTGNAQVVHFVETLHGLVAVVLSALQQVMHGHGAAVVVDVVAALAVGEDLDALDEAGGVGRGWGQRVGGVRVPDAEGDLDGLGNEGRAAGQRDAADPRGEGAQRAGEVLHVMPRRHVAGVACFQLVAQALHQLILGSGGDYLHACLYTRILTRTAKELFFQCIDIGTGRIAFCSPKTETSYSYRAYIGIRPGGIAFCSAKPCKLGSLNVLRQPVKAGLARELGWDWGRASRRRGAACCWTAPEHGSQTERRRSCLRGCRKCYCRCAA